MTFFQSKTLALVAMTLTLLLGMAGCSKSESEESGHHEHGEEAGEEFERGPHGGRMLEEGDVAVELAIVESGAPPEFHAWVSQGGKSVAAANVKLTVDLARFGGALDRIEFEPTQDYLRGMTAIHEPHSFVVTVNVTVNDRSYRWTYESFEGRANIAADAASEAGVVVEAAGVRTIRDVLPLYGVVAVSPEAMRSVAARYPGTIRSIAKSPGDAVQRGEELATIESNESLRTYQVLAPIGGVVTKRFANAGELAGAGALFEIADLGNAIAELSVFARDVARVRPGQVVRVRTVDGAVEGEGAVMRVIPGAASANQALTVRVKLDNREHRWTPGVYVNAEVLVGGKSADVAVRADAVQSFRDWQVVFRNDGELYEAQPIELGRSDGEWVEVLGGLPAGAAYVARNSFLIKAHIQKSSASHDH